MIIQLGHTSWSLFYLEPYGCIGNAQGGQWSLVAWMALPLQSLGPLRELSHSKYLRRITDPKDPCSHKTQTLISLGPKAMIWEALCTPSI